MNTTSLSRQLAGLKLGLRTARPKTQQCRRLLATASSPATSAASSSTTQPDHNFFRISNPKTKKTRTAFAVYDPPSTTPPTTPSTTSSASSAAASASAAPALLQRPHPEPMKAFHAAQIRRMDPTGARTALFSKDSPDAAHVGDVLMVTHRRGGEPFAGVLLGIRRAGVDTAVLLRGQLTRVGVEMWFKIYSRNVAGVDVIQRRPKRARRARLTYMRKPKHDMGSVDHLVIAWRKSRNVLTSRGRGAAAAAGAGGKKDGKKEKR